MEGMPATRITWRDVLTMPEDGNRYEAIGGQLYLSPPPKNRHQRVSMKLAAALFELVDRPGHGVVLEAPVGVEFPETGEGVQPDILVIASARRAILTEEWVQGPPDLVIEILSSSTARRDRTVKRDLYQRQRVAQYWIVDPEAKQVEVWRFVAESAEPERYTDRVPVTVGTRILGEIELSPIFTWP